MDWWRAFGNGGLCRGINGRFGRQRDGAIWTLGRQVAFGRGILGFLGRPVGISRWRSGQLGVRINFHRGRPGHLRLWSYSVAGVDLMRFQIHSTFAPTRSVGILSDYETGIIRGENEACPLFFRNHVSVFCSLVYRRGGPLSGCFRAAPQTFLAWTLFLFKYLFRVSRSVRGKSVRLRVCLRVRVYARCHTQTDLDSRK